ncbi:MAG: outer membrane lipid asymmetry maintenance protein MlaD [Rhodobacteraceae bacterium]|jgi:phospholipid/cholesterol/gamma-HCH transport system substrate-binding protein|nr:outer membrane lipid asymmetry maintenance protein MlaD [Paracoccaceae bacterium]
MAENATEVLVGGVVLAAAIGFTVYAAQVTGLARGQTGTYELNASFRSAEGVAVGTDVRLAGVKVGTVTRLELNPETFFADATFTMDRRITLPDDSTVLISQEGLLGGNFVEVQPGGSPFDVEPGGLILDTQGAVSLIALLMKIFAGEDSPAEPSPSAP